MASLLAYHLVALYIPSAVIGLVYIISAIVVLVLICVLQDKVKDGTFSLPLVFRVLISFPIIGLDIREPFGEYKVQLQVQGKVKPQEGSLGKYEGKLEGKVEHQQELPGKYKVQLDVRVEAEDQEGAPDDYNVQLHGEVENNEEELEEQHQEESPESPGIYEVRLHGRKIRRFSAIAMVYIVSFVIILAMATLWSTLLIETSRACGQEGFDCFADGERVTDCETTNSTDDQLECYRFVFNYIAGFTNAGGVTFFLSIAVNTLILVMVGISKIPKSYRYVVFVIFSIFLAVLPLGFLFFNLYFPLFDLLPPDILTLWVYFVTFYFSIFACLIVGLDLQIQ